MANSYFCNVSLLMNTYWILVNNSNHMTEQYMKENLLLLWCPSRGKNPSTILLQIIHTKVKFPGNHFSYIKLYKPK